MARGRGLLQTPAKRSRHDGGATASRISPCRRMPDMNIRHLPGGFHHSFIYISVDGSTDPIASALGRIAAIGTNPTPVLAALGSLMMTNTRQRMREGIDPNGVR